MRVLIILAFLSLTGCGQKGQLYLPGPAQSELPAAEAETAVASPEQESAEVATDKKDKKD